QLLVERQGLGGRDEERRRCRSHVQCARQGQRRLPLESGSEGHPARQGLRQARQEPRRQALARRARRGTRACQQGRLEQRRCVEQRVDVVRKQRGTERFVSEHVFSEHVLSEHFGRRLRRQVEVTLSALQTGPRFGGAFYCRSSLSPPRGALWTQHYGGGIFSVVVAV